MANFNANQWYQLYVNENAKQSLWGTNLFTDHGTGAVYFNATDTTKNINKWQIYGINSTTYVLRSQEGGPNAFLCTKFEPKEQTPGQTQGLMVRGNITDESAYWTVSPWGDGTFFMTNSANGTQWHLKKKLDGGVALDSNITLPQNGQRFSFKAIEAVDNKKFSSVDLPNISATSPTTASATASATSSSLPNTPNISKGLSTAAKAGIGVGVGIVALIAFVVLVLFFWRRRKHNKAATFAVHEMSHEKDAAKFEMSHGEATKYELYNETAMKHELPNVPYQAPVELPGSNFGPRER